MPRQRNHPHHHSSAERAAHRASVEDGSPLPPKDFIYSRDPWDARRFVPGWARRTPWESVRVRSPRARALAMLGAVLLIGVIVTVVALALR